MPDNEDIHAPIEVTGKKIQEDDNEDNKRRGGDEEVFNTDVEYRQLNELRVFEESGNAEIDNAAAALLGLRKRQKPTKKNKTTMRHNKRPMMRGKTKKRRKRKKGKSHKKKKISRRGKK